MGGKPNPEMDEEAGAQRKFQWHQPLIPPILAFLVPFNQQVQLLLSMESMGSLRPFTRPKWFQKNLGFLVLWEWNFSWAPLRIFWNPSNLLWKWRRWRRWCYLFNCFVRLTWAASCFSRAFCCLWLHWNRLRQGLESLGDGVALFRQHKIMSGHCGQVGQVTINFLGVSSDFVVCLSASSVFLCGQVGSTLVTFARSFLVRFCRDTPSSWMMLGSDNVAPVAARGWSVRNPMIGLINICCDLVRPRKDTRYDDIRYCDPGHRKDNGWPEFPNILRRWLVVVPCLCLSCWVSLQPWWTTFPWCRTAVLAKVLCSQKIHSSHVIWASPRNGFPGIRF